VVDDPALGNAAKAQVERREGGLEVNKIHGVNRTYATVYAVIDNPVARFFVRIFSPTEPYDTDLSPSELRRLSLCWGVPDVALR
jgi:hypothetical protein